MKLTDYVADFLGKQGVKHVFGLTGGAAVHLFDSVSANREMGAVFLHHEQAAALAAEGYARVTDGLGVAMVTTGPGGTNAVTGLCAAWLDSVPCLYVSGQARLAHTSRGKGIRQLGTQELDIVTLVGPLTKYAAMVEDPKTIRYHLEKAVYIATHGRPGPVWLDLPLDLQWASVDADALPGFDPSELGPGLSAKPAAAEVRRALELLAGAERPVVLAGYGVRLSHAQAEFKRLIEELKIPFLTTWDALDLMPTDGKLCLGRPGTFGQRGANLAIQNCDLLLCLGSHLAIPVTGTNLDAFARGAKIIMVDIDRKELDFKAGKVALAVQCDAGEFLREMLGAAGKRKRKDIGPWLERCSKYKAYNAVSPKGGARGKFADPYVFIDTLSGELAKDDVVVVDGGGTVNQLAAQAFRAKEGQRYIISAGLCAMGTGLPEAVGASFARGGRRVICLCGDGSMQFNVQELQTVAHHKLPVKIFILNNGGYLSIRNTQDGFFDGNYIGSSAAGGMSLPDFKKVARAYGVKAVRFGAEENLAGRIREVLDAPGPVVCELMVRRDQEIAPRMGFRRNPDGTSSPMPLEDMVPFLDRKEFAENMLVEPLSVSKW